MKMLVIGLGGWGTEVLGRLVREPSVEQGREKGTCRVVGFDTSAVGGRRWLHALPVPWDAGESLAPLTQPYASPEKGRLAFQKNRAFVESVLAESLDGFPSGDEPLEIFVVASATGETGSGLLIELGRMLGTLVSDRRHVEISCLLSVCQGGWDSSFGLALSANRFVTLQALQGLVGGPGSLPQTPGTSRSSRDGPYLRAFLLGACESDPYPRDTAVAAAAFLLPGPHRARFREWEAGAIRRAEPDRREREEGGRLWTLRSTGWRGRPEVFAARDLRLWANPAGLREREAESEFAYRRVSDERFDPRAWVRDAFRIPEGGLARAVFRCEALVDALREASTQSPAGLLAEIEVLLDGLVALRERCWDSVGATAESPSVTWSVGLKPGESPDLPEGLHVSSSAWTDWIEQSWRSLEGGPGSPNRIGPSAWWRSRGLEEREPAVARPTGRGRSFRPAVDPHRMAASWSAPFAKGTVPTPGEAWDVLLLPDTGAGIPGGALGSGDRFLCARFLVLPVSADAEHLSRTGSDSVAVKRLIGTGQFPAVRIPGQEPAASADPEPSTPPRVEVPPVSDDLLPFGPQEVEEPHGEVVGSPYHLYVIRHEYPHPIAEAFSRIVALEAAQAPWHHIGNLWRSFLGFLGILLISDYCSSGRRTNETDTKIERRLLEGNPADGTWLELLKLLAEVLSGREGEGAATADVVAVLARKEFLERADKAVKLRNKIEHLQAGESPVALRLLKKLVVSLVAEMEVLRNWKLISVIPGSMAPGKPEFTARIFQGWDDKEVLIRCSASRMPQVDRLLAVNVVRGVGLYVDPLIQYRACPSCGEPHLFVFNHRVRHQAEYASSRTRVMASGDDRVTVDHAFRDRQSLAAIKSLLSREPSSTSRQETYRSFHLPQAGSELNRRLDLGRRLRSSNREYEVDAFLDRGGMAEVYRARRLSDGVFVALKVLPKHLVEETSLLSRFLGEGRTAAELKPHPNVVGLQDFGADDGCYFIAMELADGWQQGPDSFVDVGRLPKRQSPKVVRSVAHQVLEGLAHIHRSNVIHRDLKPGNLLLFAPDRVKIGDFGIACIPGEEHITLTGMPLGTPAYMSPEQIRGNRGEMTCASDLYSLGVVLYELATGSLPFWADTPMGILAAQMDVGRKAPPPRQCNPSIPVSLDRFIARLLEKNVRNRFATAREALKWLESAGE